MKTETLIVTVTHNNETTAKEDLEKLFLSNMYKEDGYSVREFKHDHYVRLYEEAIEQLSSLKEDIKAKNSEIFELESTIETLESENASLVEQIDESGPDEAVHSDRASR